ncbi:MAG: response regulator [Phycisphaerae bacterium]|nr:response regulator [Tepidisphaeraceae bacterium]
MSAAAVSILLVEDDRSLQWTLREFLADQGFETHVAGTRAAGLEMLQRLRPAVCLLDMNLPDGSGADLLRAIAQDGLGVRAIVMSAFPVEQLRGRYPASVLSDVLVKPVSPEELLAAVDRIVRGDQQTSSRP